MSQSIKEFKKITSNERSKYDKNTAVVLAGRDSLCLNEEVQKLASNAAKNQACSSKIRGKKCDCIYYTQDIEFKVNELKKRNDNQIFDVEDLLQFGASNFICPYFASKIIQKKSQVTFLPYNYLLNRKIRKLQNVKLSDSVIIFDEGHNIERVCEDSMSTDLHSDSLLNCIQQMPITYDYFDRDFENNSLVTTLNLVIRIEDLHFLDFMFNDLQKQINLKIQELLRKNEKVVGYQTDWLFNIFNEIGLSFKNLRRIIEIVSQLEKLFSKCFAINGRSLLNAVTSLRNMLDFLTIFLPDDLEDHDKFKEELIERYIIYIEIEDEQLNNRSMVNWSIPSQHDNSNVNVKWILHLWCLSPSVGLKSLMKENVRSVILTSGTLAPLDSFEFEFDTKFECKIQNQHIIKISQMCIFPVSRFYNTKLDSSYNNKDNINYYKAIGETIVSIAKNVPDGILLFFSSYSVMNNSINKWKENDTKWKVWSTLVNTKQIFMESKSKKEFNDEIMKFKANVDQDKGSIFFSICRGKLSEGIDVSDKYSRAVILIGLPYPGKFFKNF